MGSKSSEEGSRGSSEGSRENDLKKPANSPGMVINQGKKYTVLGFEISQSEIILLVFVILYAVFSGVILAIGKARGWDADVYDPNNPDPRFDPEPDNPRLRGHHYYWQLPPEQVTALTRFSVWFSYALHQIAAWIVIYTAQKKTEQADERYSNSLVWFNWASILINAVFHGVHLLQTHLAYDGLAQDVVTASSQGSVIMLIIFVSIIEYRDRGLAFGWPNQESSDKIAQYVRVPVQYTYLIRKYHGYGFAWAAIYTFWFHPMESTVGHVLGFFYTSIIMLQGSLMFTKAHLNRYWRLFIESYVIIHGGVIAWQTGGLTLWPMFVFGFALYFAMTQIFTLRVWYDFPGWVRIIPMVIYMAVTVGCYSQIPDSNGVYWVRLSEIIRIPGVYYLGAVVNLILLFPCTWIVRKFAIPERSVFYESTMISLMLVAYSVAIGASAMLKTPEIEAGFDLITLMIVMISIFTVLILIGNIFLALARGDSLPEQQHFSKQQTEQSNVSKTTEII